MAASAEGAEGGASAARSSVAALLTPSSGAERRTRFSKWSVVKDSQAETTFKARMSVGASSAPAGTAIASAAAALKEARRRQGGGNRGSLGVTPDGAKAHGGGANWKQLIADADMHTETIQREHEDAAAQIFVSEMHGGTSLPDTPHETHQSFKRNAKDEQKAVAVVCCAR